MATGFTKNFVVKNGITTGPITLDASSGNITGTNLFVTGTSELGAISNVTITGGSSGQAIITDGSGNLTFGNVATSSNPAPMPTYVPIGNTVTIAANYQGLFGYPITIDGTMTVDGILIDINDNRSGGGGTANALNATIANVSISGGTSGQYLSTNGSGTLSWVTPITTSIVSGTTQTASQNYRYVLSNASTTTVILPSSPTLGDTVYLVVANDLSTNIVARNGQKIMSLEQDMTITSSNAAFGLLYTNSTLGWRVI